MMKPTASDVVPAITGPDELVLIARDFDCSNVDNGFLYPLGRFNVASFQVVGRSGTLSSGALQLIVSNDPDLNECAAHPTATALSAPGITAAVSTKYHGVGVRVTTAQAVTVNIFMCLKRVET